MMTEQLFSNARWHTVETKTIESAVNEASRLSAEVVNDPNRTEDEIRKIIKKYKFAIPQLHAEKKRATKREEKRSYKDYGQLFEKSIVILDVSIPFTGDADAFRIAPKTAVKGLPQAQVNKNALVLPVVMSERTSEQIESEVNDFIDRVNTNLVNVRRDSAEFPQRIEVAVRQAIEARKQKLASEMSVTSNLSFPVDE